MLSALHYGWGRAYRDGQLVSGRVRLIISLATDDERLGLAPRERQCIAASFADPQAPLRRELELLLEAGGVRGLRLAETLDPIELVDDHGGRVVGRLEPPTSRNRPPDATSFRIRETTS